MDRRPTPAFSPPVYRSVSPARTWAMVMRYLYLMKGSWPRIIELINLAQAQLQKQQQESVADGEITHVYSNPVRGGVRG